MAALTRADFARPPTGVSRNNADLRGWGPGWPHCQTSKWAKVQKAGVVIIVRREVAELAATLLAITEELGYDVRAGQTWGAACRAIRGTSYPSNHSWGLAIDMNSLSNPMGTTFSTNIPPRVVDAWWQCGWFWGGWYLLRPDTMHFEYVHAPSQVGDDLRKAKAMLAKLRNPDAGKYGKWSTAAYGVRTLKKGDQGTDVIGVQRVLADKPEDGKFDGNLTKLVRAYQKAHHLTVDGVVGPKTWAPIQKALKK